MEATNHIVDGTQAPNPSYEIPIHNVSGNNNIKIQNKNLAVSEFTDKLSLSGSGQNRTITLSAYKLSQVIKVKPNTTYTITGNYSSLSDQRIRIFYFDEKPILNSVSTKYIFSDINSAYTFTTDNNTNYILLYGSVTSPQDVIIPNLQLEQGSTATDYVPHQEQNLPLNLRSKNLLDYKTVEATPNTTVQLINNGFKVTGKFAGKVTITGLKPNTNYYLQYIRENITGNVRQVSIFGGTGTSQRIKDLTNPDIFNTGDNTTINIWFYTSIGGSDGESNFTNIQLEEGSTATSYEPYYNYELSKIDTAEDYFLKENGKWYLHKETGKEIYEGSIDENWISNITEQKSIFYIQLSNKIQTKKGLLSNKYKYTLSGWDVMENYNICEENNNNYIFIRDNRFENTTLFKTELSTKNLIVYYVLATPTNTEITETPLINQLEAIKKAKAYKEVTYIEATSSDLEPIIKVQYWKSEE